MDHKTAVKFLKAEAKALLAEAKKTWKKFDAELEAHKFDANPTKYKKIRKAYEKWLLSFGKKGWILDYDNHTGEPLSLSIEITR